MTRVNLSLVAVLLASIFTVGCSGNKVSADDSQITTDIQSKLYSDPTTKQSTINVAVSNGTVTLSGDVPNSDVELAAMKIANGTAGVHGVADQMKVAAASNAMGQTAPADTAPPSTGQTSPAVAPQSASNRAPVAAQPSSPAPAVADAPPVASAPPPAPVDQAPPRVVRPAEPERVTIAAGDRLSVRTIDAIDSGKATDGQSFRASLDSPLTSKGRVIVPAGASVTLQVASVKGAGRIRGESSLSLQATSLEYRGRNYPVTTSAVEEQGKARGKNTAIKTGIGAGLGALIGGLAGGGKGAAIGAGAGGGVGFGANALTHGQQVKIPSETVLTFRLESPLTVPAPR